MDSMRTLRLWAAAAWADGVLHPAEAAALERYLEHADDLTDADRSTARGFLAAAPDVDVAEVRDLPAEAREGVYRAALGIVRLDREVADDERAFLAKLRTALDLDEATIARIEAEGN